MQSLIIYLKKITSNDMYIVTNNWIDYIQNELRLSKNTIKSYLSDLVLFFNFIHIINKDQIDINYIKNIKINTIREWLSHRKQNQNIKNSSNSRAISSLHSFFSFLYEKKIIAQNIIDILSRPKIEKHLPKPASLEEILTIIENSENEEGWVNSRNALLFVLIYASGMRISEALSLKQEDFIKDNIVITGKGGKQRIIPKLGILKKYYEDYLSKCPFISQNKDIIFFGKNGNKLNRTFMAKIMQRIRINLGLNESITLHSLRHSFATHLIQNNANIRVVQQLLGHSSLSTTQLYTKLSNKSLKNIYSKYHPLSKK